jgi:alpha-beta hydrolase superfamily lysophospholipase
MIKSKKKSIVEEIHFSSEEFMLKGYLHLPPVSAPPFVIGCHGLFSDKSSPKQIELAYHCNQYNIAYFRFDHRGCGESKAPSEMITSLAARCTDLKVAAALLKARNDLGGRMGFFGSSMGGTVCLAVARDTGVDAVVTWAAPVRSHDLVQHQPNPAEGSEIPFKRNPFDITRQLTGLRNTLVLHGDADETVPLLHAKEIHQYLKAPKKLIVFPQSDHRMSNPADQKKFIQQASGWLNTYLTPRKS